MPLCIKTIPATLWRGLWTQLLKSSIKAGKQLDMLAALLVTELPLSDRVSFHPSSYLLWGLSYLDMAVCRLFFCYGRECGIINQKRGGERGGCAPET